MEEQETTVLTTRQPEALLEEFREKTKALGAKEGPFLAHGLAIGLSELSEAPTNSAAAYEYLMGSLRSELPPRKRVGFRLPTALVREINAVCEEKRVPRDRYIQAHIELMVRGSEKHDIVSPMDKAWVLLFEPTSEIDGARNFYADRCHVPDSLLLLLQKLQKREEES